MLYQVTEERNLGVSKAEEKLKLAQRHLERVLGAWEEAPTDWDDLSLYGFYCLEAAVEAGALHVGFKTSKKPGRRRTPRQNFTRSMGGPTSNTFFMT
jgi:hypothetical protein